MFEIREKPEMVERAMLVSIYFDPSEAREKQAMLDELEDLVTNLGIKMCIRDREGPEGEDGRTDSARFRAGHAGGD